MEETWIGDDGYERVTLVDSFGREKIRKVHELVAEAFIPNPEGKKHVHHINGGKLDNRAVNLAWV